MNGAASGPTVVAAIVAKEMRELFRDRRAVFFAFVLPLFLYPAAFFGIASLPTHHAENLRRRILPVGVSGDARGFLKHVELEDFLAAIPGEFREEVVREGELLAFVDIEAPERRSVRDRKAGRDGEATGGAIRARIHYLSTSPSSNEACRRVYRILERWKEEALETKFRRRGAELRIDELVRVRAIDVSTEVESSAADLGRMLPFVLVLLLLTGGAFAALDLVAGEKERGTLETLCVQPVSHGQLVTGKFLVVFVTSLASVLLNLLGLLAALALGLGPRGTAEAEIFAFPLDSLPLVGLLLLPLAVLSSAALLGISAYARSYREAQTYLLPLTVLALLPAALAASPQVTVSGAVAVVPVANVAVALRGALVGNLDPLPLTLVLASTSFYAILTLRWTASSLAREEVLLGLEAPPLLSDASGEVRERRGLAFGAVMLLAVYFGGTWLQSGKFLSFPAGLAITLWVLVPGPALLYASLSPRSFREVLALRRPRLLDLVLCASMAAAASLLAAGYLQIQESFLPFPQGLQREFEELFELEGYGPFVRFLLFAVSPAITEEILWRGVFQSDLEARGRPLRAILLVGLFFGLFHLSIYRLVPTALAGVALAAIRLRTGSIFPCMVFHAAFNGVSLFLLPAILGVEGDRLSLLDRPFTLLAAAALLIFGYRSLSKAGSAAGGAPSL